MLIVSTILFCSIVGSLGAWQSDIDNNRVQLIKNEDTHRHTPRNPHSRRSILSYKFKHDNDDYSSRVHKLRPSMYLVSDSQTTKPSALKVYQPRQDPRLFYQSDAYAKEVNENRINNEVTAVYPGKDVVRAGVYYRKSARFRERETNDVHNDDICVTCPQDRTVIARPGSDRVMLQHPRLKSCYGYRVPRDVTFVPMYGPEFGTLLQKGSHGILGQIKYKGKMLRYCYMTVHVLIQTCALPNYLIGDCGDRNKTCSFTCRDPKTELHGSSSLTCGADLKWTGPLPVCSAPTWCEPPSPPAHGRVSCKGSTLNNWGLAEGSICRVKCARSRNLNTRPVAICLKGAWSNTLTCTK